MDLSGGENFFFILPIGEIFRMPVKIFVGLPEDFVQRGESVVIEEGLTRP